MQIIDAPIYGSDMERENPCSALKKITPWKSVSMSNVKTAPASYGNIATESRSGEEGKRPLGFLKGG
jgi:hypothetical protein